MIFVCNTGPLIALAKIDRLSLLQNTGTERVLIPPMVQRELRSKIGAESSLIESALNHFIHVVEIERTDQRLVRATSNLDDGEKKLFSSGHHYRRMLSYYLMIKLAERLQRISVSQFWGRQVCFC